MRSRTERAPAKLNLALDILGKRSDGYHEMRMVMQRISLCDWVTVRETEEPGFRLLADFEPLGKQSLEERAARAFFSRLGQELPGLEVQVEKQIPAYAGMGGGSADVAALLRGLRSLYAPELSDQELEAIGLTIGSDVPFCIRGGTALAEGRGEQLTPLPPLPPCWFLICKPGFDLPTPSLFGRVRVEALEGRPDLPSMEAALQRGDLLGVAQNLGNVFESVLAEEETQEIQRIQEIMRRFGALNASMTGSGPTVFGMFTAEAALSAAEAALKKQYQQVFRAEPE